LGDFLAAGLRPACSRNPLGCGDFVHSSASLDAGRFRNLKDSGCVLDRAISECSTEKHIRPKTTE
jgi:hypothetical protein